MNELTSLSVTEAEIYVSFKKFAKITFSKYFLYLYAVGKYTSRGLLLREVTCMKYDVPGFTGQTDSSCTNRSDSMAVALQ
jgi:hypothetical protein